MNMKVLSKACLLAVCSISLASCGTPKVVKQAKAYMSAHKEDFKGWSGTLVYEGEGLKVNVVTGRGSYSGDNNYKVSFRLVWNWDENKLVEYKKFDSKNGNAISDAAVKVSIAAVYGVVYTASAAYEAEQAAK